MNMTRRQFFLHMGILGAGFMKTNGYTQTLIDDAEAFEPTGQIEWLGDSFLWIGALKWGDTVKYSLIRKRLSQRAEFLAPVDGPRLCRPGSSPYLYARGPGGVSTVQVSGPKLQAISLIDKGLALENCSFSVAREINRLERSGSRRLTALAISTNVTTGTSHDVRPLMLGCRPTESRVASEILLFDGSNAPRSVTVDWPLALDNPVLLADPHSDDWLAYPSLAFQRRQAFRNSLLGIPVCRITRNLELSLTWVLWDEWNESGPYSFFPLGSGLVGATYHGWTDKGERLSGVYLPDGKRWKRRFGGQVDAISLAVSADQKRLAWREQIKVEPPSTLYGKLRHVARIEAI